MKPQFLTEETFHNFAPEILFASDSERGTQLIGIWSNKDGAIGFDYEVRKQGIDGCISRHTGLASACRAYNGVHFHTF